MVINNNSKLKAKYSDIWNELEESRNQARNNVKKIYAYTISNFYSPQYLSIAKNLVGYANQLKNNEITRDKYDSLTAQLFPKDFSKELQDKLLIVQLNIIKNNLPADDKIVKDLLDGNTTEQAAKNLLLKSNLTSKEKLLKITSGGYESVLNSNDPFIYYVLNTQDELKQMQDENKARVDKEEILNQMLGEALYKVYGDVIPQMQQGLYGLRMEL